MLKNMNVSQNGSFSVTKPNVEKTLELCIEFLHSIGIKTIDKKLTATTFLPGLSIEAGCIVIDRETLCYPGDILHEAAHIAIVPAADRHTLDEAAISERPDREAEEMMAIAWSYAACIHLNLDPHFVFHDDGYKGGGSYIADNFKEKRYFGLPMLQWKGMAADEKKAAELNVAPYPSMIKWMQD
jgi:hypothetical protein